MTVKREEFASRWGIILAGLGMAVGTGNMWRFPRIVAQYGSGAFMLVWIFFLFLWGIPLLVIEMSIGKKTRKGVIGSFVELMSEKQAWMGTFVTFVTAAITFYYTVVTGWCLKYFIATIFQGLVHKNPTQFWDSFASSWQPAFFHFLAIFIGCAIIYAGVVKGIERANRIFIPSLFLILIIASVRSISLPGALAGLDFLFSPNLKMLGDYRLWLNALSQTAWSTGAGWGLMLTYAVYSHKKENPVRTATTLGFGDYVASLLAAITVIPAVFSYFAGQGVAHQQVIKVMSEGNRGLTFTWIPTLFAHIPGGTFFLALFFLALCFAAFSSLISQLELITRVIIDSGATRRLAVIIVGLTCFFLGLPSALSLGFFDNQDWVWGLGLMVSGSFIIMLVIKVGTRKFRREIIPEISRGPLKTWIFDVLVKFLMPIQVIAMLVWWFWSSYKSNPRTWFNPFLTSSVGTVLLQWGVAIIVFLLLNKTIARLQTKSLGE
ncbi:MAG: sodium-dependent transporter [Candidatus Aminicenantes bacterium 4484_214]|nr:MAG: sodium-dependent transporter [Candidatus Aminicenantes bacterium 4484_214]